MEPQMLDARRRFEFLANHEPWARLTDETRTGVAAAFEPRSHRPGDHILRQDDEGGRMHVVVSGQLEVRVRSGGGPTRTVATLREGDCVGEMSILTGDPVSADVVSVGDSSSLVMSRQAFEELAARDAALVREFIRVLSNRVRARGMAVGEAQQREEDLTSFIEDEKANAYGPLVGAPKTLKALEASITAVSKDESPLLIYGEPGSGREAVARLVHSRSRRKDGPLLSADCTQIAETPLGDKLLGPAGRHMPEHGANAPLSYVGLADGGTVILRNIETLPRTIQERLGRVLGGVEAGVRPDARVIALASASPQELVEGGQLSPGLAAAFADHAVATTPLRERKKDIPQLAKHFLTREAARLRKEVRSFTDEAVTKLVSQDYRAGNVQELRSVVERAVALTSTEIVGAEEVFSSAPPSPHRAWRLLSWAALRRSVVVFPRAIRLVVALSFASLVALCLFATRRWQADLATQIAWCVWWPGLVLSFFFLGRAWCGVCPMATAGDLVQKLRSRERRIPAWLKNHDADVMAAGFFAILWVEEACSMRHSAFATGLLLLVITGGAIATSATFARRTWCRYVCPLGGFAGVCASSAMTELRPTLDVCSAQCSAHACYKGSGEVPGCPMFAHVMFLESNAECVMCMNCVRTCPNGSPRMNVRVPGQELWTGPGARPSLSRFVGVLVGMVPALALLWRWELSGWKPFVQYHLAVVTLVLLAAGALPLALLAVWSKATGPGDAEAALHRRVVSWAPLVAAGFVCHHFGFIPRFDTIRLILQSGAAGADGAALGLSVLTATRAALLLAGLVTTGVVLRVQAKAAGFGSMGDWLRRDGPLLAGAAAYAIVVAAIMCAAQSS